ncbi:MAG: lipopolysaccharide biosynthesis protein [Acidimicrobiales bacterium]
MAPNIRSLMQKAREGELATESLWGLAVELTTLVGTIVSFTLLGRTLGAAGYGGYAALYAIIGPLVTLAASGVVLAVLQHIVRDHEPIEETARSCLSITLGLGILLTFVGAGLALLIVDTLSVVAIGSILLTEFVASAIVQVAASTVQAGTGFTGAAKIRLVLLVSKIAVLFALFVTDTLTVASFGVGMLAVASTLAVWSLWRVGRLYGFRFVPGRVKMHHLKTNALYSVAISGASLNSEGDKLVLAANRYVVDTGLYAAAYRVVSFGLIPVGSLVQVTHRRFLQHDEGVKGQHLARSLRFASVAGVYGIVFGIALFVAAPLLPLLMGDEFEGSVVMVRWLAPIVALRAVGIFALNGLMGLNRVALRTVIIVANAVVSLGLYIVLIPPLGWEGAAIGTLISESLVVVTTWWALVVCQRRADRVDVARSSDRGRPDGDE